MPGLFHLAHHRHAVTKLLRGDNHARIAQDLFLHKKPCDCLGCFDRSHPFNVKQTRVRDRDLPRGGDRHSHGVFRGIEDLYFHDVSGAYGAIA